MQEVFEKIIEKLKEISIFMTTCDGYGANCVSVGTIEEIVKQEAEKFGTDINVGSNGWIPCSERLPKEYGDYLVAWRPLSMSAEDIMKKVGREVPHFYEIVEYDPNDEALWIGSIEQAQGEYEIIAWQPLPEPYHPKFIQECANPVSWEEREVEE